MTAEYGFQGSRVADFTLKKDLSLVRQKGEAGEDLARPVADDQEHGR